MGFSIRSCADLELEGQDAEVDEQIIRGPLLNPGDDGRVRFFSDGALMGNRDGRIAFAGEWRELSSQLGSRKLPTRTSDGIVIPAMLDAHIHIPQNPIRGRFTEGIDGRPAEGRLLAGLNRNVFPEEARDSDAAYAENVVTQFLKDTLAQGVIGGAAYMTVHAQAARAALQALPAAWSVGMVLMNMNCPGYLRTNEATVDADITALARDFANRFIVTDRFAVSVDTALRKRAAGLAGKLGLRTQTHLNEQRAEKALVEDVLYPTYDSYTDVYLEDGLLDHRAIMAHCIHMQKDELRILRDKKAAVAHCPTSNSLLGSGIMPLDEINARRLPYAICTDVGASPTTSLLCEMEHYLLVHSSRHDGATAEAALMGVTLAPARILGLDRDLGSFKPGKRLAFVEIECGEASMNGWTAEDAILKGVLETSKERVRAAAGELGDVLGRLQRQGLDEEADLRNVREAVDRSIRKLEQKVMRTTVDGTETWQRGRSGG
jgi:guanine deaminase